MEGDEKESSSSSSTDSSGVVQAYDSREREGGRWEGGWGAACYSRESQVRRGEEEEEEGAAKERKIGGRGFGRRATVSRRCPSLRPSLHRRSSVAGRGENFKVCLSLFRPPSLSSSSCDPRPWNDI